MHDHAQIKALLVEAKALRAGSSIRAEGAATVVRVACMGGAKKTFRITPMGDGRFTLEMAIDKPKRRDPSGAFKHAQRIEDNRAGIYPEQLGAIIRGWRP